MSDLAFVSILAITALVIVFGGAQMSHNTIEAQKSACLAKGGDAVVIERTTVCFAKGVVLP